MNPRVDAFGPVVIEVGDEDGMRTIVVDALDGAIGLRLERIDLDEDESMLLTFAPEHAEHLIAALMAAIDHVRGER